MQIFQACETKDCDNQPVLNVKLGPKTRNYCCQKGLDKALYDYQRSINGNLNSDYTIPSN